MQSAVSVDSLRRRSGSICCGGGSGNGDSEGKPVRFEALTLGTVLAKMKLS